MIAGRVLGKGRYRSVAIEGFSHVDAPLRPAIRRAIGARLLHGGNIVGVPSEAGAQPGDDDVAVGIGSDPWEHVGLANRAVPVDADWRCPGVSEVRGRSEKDTLVVRPDRIDVAEVVDGKRREDVGGASRAGEDLVVSEGDGRS